MKFMSLGGNCAGIACLGPERERGPIDNWRVRHGLLSIISLFDGSFIENVKKKNYEVQDRRPIVKSDPGKNFIFSEFDCFHIDVSKDEVIEKVEKRLQQMSEFKKQVEENDDCFFVYFLSVGDTYKHKATKNFLKGLEELKKYVNIDKVIFCGSKVLPGHRTYFNYSFDEPVEGIHYIEVEDIALANTITKRTIRNGKDFLEKVTALDLC